MSNIRIDGLDGLIRRLRQVRSDADAVTERGLLKAGHKVRKKAVMLCPVGQIHGGALKRSIQVEKAAPLTVAVGTNKEYAPYVEYGTGTKGDPEVPHTDKEYWRYQDEEGKWHTSHGQPARPFLRPAVDEREITETVAEEIRRGIRNA